MQVPIFCRRQVLLKIELGAKTVPSLTVTSSTNLAQLHGTGVGEGVEVGVGVSVGVSVGVKVGVGEAGAEVAVGVDVGEGTPVDRAYDRPAIRYR